MIFKELVADTKDANFRFETISNEFPKLIVFFIYYKMPNEKLNVEEILIKILEVTLAKGYK